MFPRNFVRLCLAGMLLILLMSDAVSYAQPKSPATPIMVYQGWG